MDLVWSVFALTVAALTLVLATRRIVNLVSETVFARYVAVGGLVSFTVEHLAEDTYRLRFEVGGPGVFHNVGVQIRGTPDVTAPPPLRHTMTAGDEPIEWTVPLTDGAWVLVTWVRPYLQGVEPEALAQRLGSGQLYEWRWYSESTRYLRTIVRALARRYSRAQRSREIATYGRWRRTTTTDPHDLLGPVDSPPPAG